MAPVRVGSVGTDWGTYPTTFVDLVDCITDPVDCIADPVDCAAATPVPAPPKP